MMADDRSIENRFLKLEEFLKNLVQTSDALDDEAESLGKKLSKINSRVTNFQNKKKELDVLKQKLGTIIENFNKNRKEIFLVEAHLEHLKKHKHLLENYSTERALEIEGKTVNENVDRMWEYFNEKNLRLDEEISQEETKLVNQQEEINKAHKKESSHYKKSIEKLKENNEKINKMMILFTELQKEQLL